MQSEVSDAVQLMESELRHAVKNRAERAGRFSKIHTECRGPRGTGAERFDGSGKIGAE